MRAPAHYRLVCLAALFLCGAAPSLAQSQDQPVTSAAPTPIVPASSHVYLVVLENGTYSTVTNSGDSTHYMPWMIGLGNTYGHSTNYITNSGGSLLAYLWLSSGFCHSDTSTTADCPKTIPPGVTPVNRFGCTGGSCVSPITDDNIYREMVADNITWTLYFESLPSVGYMGGSVGNYDPHHNPAKWYSDVINSTAFQQHMVPFTQFSTDLANNQMPKYALIIPDDSHNAHDGTPQAADQWLQTNVGPLLNQPFFQPGGDGVLIITFDNQDDDGSGQVYWTIIGPKVKRGYISNTFLQHQDTLLTVLQALGIGARPGYTSIATGMAEFFTQPKLSVTRQGSGTGTVTSNDGSINCGSTCSAIFNDGTPITLTANPAAGSAFAGWGGACSGTQTTCNVTMSSAQAVTASFIQTFALTVTKQGTGSGTVTSSDGVINCGIACSATYNSGTTITLTATPASGSTFSGWGGTCVGTQPCTLTMSAAQAVSATFTQTPIVGLHFMPATPCRIADTRLANGPFGGPFLSARSSRSFTIPSSACNIPATAQAYSLNVTVVPRGPLGFLTTFPCGQPLPVASTLNSIDGRAKAVAAIVPAGTNGDVCFYVSDDTELVLDIDGYFVAPAAPNSLSFYPVTPCRLVDTRLASGPFGGPFLVGNATGRTFPIRGQCNLPLTAQAYSLNYTTVPRQPLGFLTTWPAGQVKPIVSTLNAVTGTATANAAIVPAAANGDVSVFVSDDTDLVIDVNGYFAPPGPGGLSFYRLLPCRVLDTRTPPNSQFAGTLSVNVTASGCGTPASAQAYVLNATVVPPAALGFLTLWPQGTARPIVSTLNAADGTVTSNMAIVPTTNGSINVYAADMIQLVLDISGYFAP
jgi:hypothetical protein